MWFNDIDIGLKHPGLRPDDPAPHGQRPASRLGLRRLAYLEDRRARLASEARRDPLAPPRWAPGVARLLRQMRLRRPARAR